VCYSREVIYPLGGRVFRLDALIWLVKVSPDDCDLHIELSALGGRKNSFRVIAEVPNDPEYMATWTKGFCFKNRYWDIIYPSRPSYTLLAIDP
jgi:hypothetical protein